MLARLLSLPSLKIPPPRDAAPLSAVLKETVVWASETEEPAPSERLMIPPPPPLVPFSVLWSTLELVRVTLSLAEEASEKKPPPSNAVFLVNTVLSSDDVELRNAAPVERRTREAGDDRDV